MGKKMMVGYGLIAAGGTALLCLLLFAGFGYRVFLAPEVQLEPGQSQAPAASLGSEGIEIPRFDTWTIPAGETTVPTHFYNPEGNGCYFVLRVTLDESGETIYESDYLEPGQSLYEVELSGPLPAGSYDATIHYSAFSMADLAALNGAQVQFELVVQP